MRRQCACLLLAGTLGFGADVTFVLLNDQTGKLSVENAERAKLRIAPCSTFKIPNAAIALETRVVPDEHYTIRYDVKRHGEQSEGWARDFDLASALQASAVWYFREMAKGAGPERMAAMLKRFDYGNQDISAGIDKFWLGSSLRISALEQVEFLRRLHEGRLGLTPKTTATVREMLLLETGPDYRWYGKTGTCTDDVNGHVAWHVGFVERDTETTYYALNFPGASLTEVFRARPKIIRERLATARLIAPESPSPREQMQNRIQAAIQVFPGTVGIFAKNLETGESFGVRADERVRTASTIKLPIMAAAFAAVESGKARWEDTREMTAEDKVSGSGVLGEFSPGSKIPLRDLVNLMIVVSDNTATNLVLDHISADYVNAQMNSLGLVQTRALRKVLGDGANLKPVASGHSKEGLQQEFKRFGLGVSTPHEMVTLLEKLERGEVVSAAASKAMLEILKRQHYKDGIGRRLPDAQVASKSGSLDRLRSDVGIVYSPRGRVAIAITVDDMMRTDYSPDNAGTLLISELTGYLLDGLTAEPKR